MRWWSTHIVGNHSSKTVLKITENQHTCITTISQIFWKIWQLASQKGEGTCYIAPNRITIIVLQLSNVYFPKFDKFSKATTLSLHLVLIKFRANNTIPIELHKRIRFGVLNCTLNCKPKDADYRGSIVVKTHFDCNILVSIPRDIILTAQFSKVRVDPLGFIFVFQNITLIQSGQTNKHTHKHT